MNRRTGVAAGVLGATAAGLVAAGLTAGRAAADQLRRPPEPAEDALAVPVDGDPVWVTTDDGLRVYAEVDDLPDRHDTTPLTVVFLHGYALSHLCWRFQRLALRHRMRVVLYDQRSHGRSERAPADRCTIAATGADLARVLERCAPDGPVVLVGHSMGGMSIMSFAQQHPDVFAERVVGVGLVATSADGIGFSFGLDNRVGTTVGRLTPALVAALVRLPTLVERSRSVDNDVSLLLARHWSFASNVAGERVQFVAQILSRTPMEVVADFYPTFTSHDGFGGLAEFHGRELLVVGARQDRITPIRHSRAIAEALPEAEYVELDPSGHLAMIEHPDRVGAAIEDLLDRAGAAWTKRIGAGEADR